MLRTCMQMLLSNLRAYSGLYTNPLYWGSSELAPQAPPSLPRGLGTRLLLTNEAIFAAGHSTCLSHTNEGVPNGLELHGVTDLFQNGLPSVRVDNQNTLLQTWLLGTSELESIISWFCLGKEVHKFSVWDTNHLPTLSVYSSWWRIFQYVCLHCLCY